MLKKIIDQAKAIWANKFVATGYASAIAATTAICYAQTSNVTDEKSATFAVLIPTFYFFFNLGMANGGRQTYDKFVSAKEQIRRYGKVNDNYANGCKGAYCFRKGVELAEREANRESGLESKIGGN
ncbi:MAG: hypothetical protein V1866_01375 [archaeon]